VAIGVLSFVQCGPTNRCVCIMLIWVQIRIAAAETLWFLTQEERLKRQDWSLPSKKLKPVVDDIKAELIVG
jgi:hypothetical protein